MKKLKELNKLIDDAEKILKQEFFGIDKQIEQVLENIKPWLYFPEAQDRPLVINLWGMTGCGKTSLIKRVTELLNLKKYTSYFNFAQLSEQSTWEIEELLSEHVSDMNIETPVFIYDEFQYARTIDENGKEIDKPALKVFWELLDSGVYRHKWNYSAKYNIMNLKRTMDYIIKDDEIVIENGKLISGSESLEKFQQQKLANSSIWTDVRNEDVEDKDETIFSKYQKGNIFSILNKKFPQEYTHIERVYEDFKTFNKVKLYEYVNRVSTFALEDVEMNFSKSLIFVLGNVDEAYRIAYSVDPDMTADHFYEVSKNINIVDIKKALQYRFRNEQIARLGNIHLIYPSFNSDTYNKIIQLNIDIYKNKIKELYNINLLFDNSINEIIYKEGVFPTQGTRPIFTSIHEILKTKLSNILTYAIDNNIKYDELIYKFEKGFMIISYSFEKSITGEYQIKQSLRLEKLREPKEDELQAICAVHEAGHAIVSIELLKQIPEKVCSLTTSSENGGFTLNDYNERDITSKTNLLADVAMLLGGRVAEELVFGTNNITNGAVSDLERVTNLVTDSVRRWGFNEEILLNNGWMQFPTGSDRKIYNIGLDQSMNDLVSHCYTLAQDAINNQMKLFKQMSKYLSKYTVLNKQEIIDYMKVFYNGDFQSIIDNDKKLYRNLLKDFCS